MHLGCDPIYIKYYQRFNYYVSSRFSFRIWNRFDISHHTTRNQTVQNYENVDNYKSNIILAHIKQIIAVESNNEAGIIWIFFTKDKR